MRDDSSRQKDFDIIHRVLEGDTDAFEALVTGYKNYVFKIVSKHMPGDLVEETAHDVFIGAFQSLKSFGYRSDFKHWLSRIALRTCYDYWRKQYRSPETAISSLSERHHRWLREVVDRESFQGFYEKGRREESKEILDWALGHLNPEDRMVIELIYLEGMSGKEVADLLGWSIANVKIRSFRSKNKLRRLLEKVVDAVS